MFYPENVTVTGMKKWILFAVAIAVYGCGTHSRSGHTVSVARSPYAGEEDRQIKALSDAEIDDLLTGRGMGFATVAELNGFPGPRHVLDLADSLGLTDDQEAQVRAVFDRMHSEAVELGRALVDSERSLDSLFASRVARDAPGRAESTIRRAADLRGRLRFAHVSAHLEMMETLTADQIASYARLRGYAADHGHAGHH